MMPETLEFLGEHKDALVAGLQNFMSQVDF
jgi:hypothetical protein